MCRAARSLRPTRWFLLIAVVNPFPVDRSSFRFPDRLRETRNSIAEGFSRRCARPSPLTRRKTSKDRQRIEDRCPPRLSAAQIAVTRVGRKIPRHLRGVRVRCRRHRPRVSRDRYRLCAPAAPTGAPTPLLRNARRSGTRGR